MIVFNIKNTLSRASTLQKGLNKAISKGEGTLTLVEEELLSIEQTMDNLLKRKEGADKGRSEAKQLLNKSYTKAGKLADALMTFTTALDALEAD
jgi:hypothetical protein